MLGKQYFHRQKHVKYNVHAIAMIFTSPLPYVWLHIGSICGL